MSDTTLTGSEASRFYQIHHNWLVFGPESHQEAIRYRLYSVPVGQQKEPIFHIFSGSNPSISGAVEIEKLTYVFDSEQDASDFITEIGEENISAYRENIESTIVEDRVNIEVDVINFPSLSFDFDFTDLTIEKGFIAEVFVSASTETGGVRSVSPELKIDGFGNIISDSYLKYFKVDGD